ncbi:MAG: sigma-70 family RNA polymerase sigma factor [Chloroflexaceae bacterium]|jgi:RNA polymerase sigma factor (sigma-70 family)|nr:sigma-70 family RNA polymerase sigma factor [Chloroflexaceae bacterium]
MEQLAQLVGRAQRGDLEAFGYLVSRFQRMAHAVAYSMTGDAHLAEDAVQEAFLEAYLCLGKLTDAAAFPGWFRRIVIKRSDRLVRGKQFHMVPLLEANGVPAAEADPPTLAERRELQNQVQQGLAALSDEERLLTTLFYFAGYQQHEIASLLELPLGTVKKRLFLARQRLRQHLGHLASPPPVVPSPAFAQLITFFLTVRVGDLAQVRQMLKSCPALVEAQERWDESTARQYGLPYGGGYAALHRAVAYANEGLVALLLAHHAPLEARTRDGQTPLHMAVLHHHPALVERLLAAGANPNSATVIGMTPLHWAVMRCRPALVERLLAVGANPRQPDLAGRTALDWAQLKGDAAMLRLLAERNLNHDNDNQQPPQPAGACA